MRLRSCSQFSQPTFTIYYTHARKFHINIQESGNLSDWMALRYDEGQFHGVERIDISDESGRQPSSMDMTMLRITLYYTALHISHFLKVQKRWLELFEHGFVQR